MAVPRTNPNALRPLAPVILGEAAAPRRQRVFAGPARLGARTKHLVKRLGPADIAVINHAGIDRVAGEHLVASGVRHVVNVSRSASEYYANQGPLILTGSGVRLVDMPGTHLFELLDDGEV